jgi:hypothetical protein
MAKERDMKQYGDAKRVWAPWYSWASPVGLGLYFIAVGFFLWLLSQAFNWN